LCYCFWGWLCLVPSDFVLDLQEIDKWTNSLLIVIGAMSWQSLLTVSSRSINFLVTRLE
jgi:hypothetical protein